MARPTKLTPELQTRICDLIRNGGVHPETAAVSAGICEKTYARWVARGKKNRSGIYVAFVRALSKSMRDWEAGLTITVRKAASKDWRAAAFLLERGAPERWGKRERLDVKAKVTHAGGVRFINMPFEAPDPTQPDESPPQPQVAPEPPANGS